MQIDPNVLLPIPGLEHLVQKAKAGKNLLALCEFAEQYVAQTDPMDIPAALRKPNTKHVVVKATWAELLRRLGYYTESLPEASGFLRDDARDDIQHLVSLIRAQNWTQIVVDVYHWTCVYAVDECMAQANPEVSSTRNPEDWARLYDTYILQKSQVNHAVAEVLEFRTHFYPYIDPDHVRNTLMRIAV